MNLREIYERDTNLSPKPCTDIDHACVTEEYVEWLEKQSDHWTATARKNVALKTACRAALARLDNPLLDTSLFDDVKQLLRIALEK